VLAAPRAPSLSSRLCSVGLIDLALPATSRDILGLWKAARQLHALLNERSRTLVHAHGLRSFAACLLAGFRPYVTVHGFGAVPSDPLGYHLVRRFGLKVAGALAAQAYSATPELQAPWSFTPYASPRLADLSILPFPDGTLPTFAWVGRLAEQKRPEMFVRALAEASQKLPVRGLVAGDGPLRDSVKTLSRNLGAPIEFLGHVDTIREVLQRSWAVILTSRWEAVSFSVQEAMWVGRAAVASDLPGLRWLIGDAGYLVNSEEQLTEAILRLTDAGHAKALGSRATARIREILTPESPFPQLEERFIEHLRSGAGG
jgi:glycosyltransferase involved in cell wall biosynthesis